MTKYKAVLFAPDGDWVTDCRAATIDEVWEKVNDLGSRWFFYPFPFVIVDHGGLTTSRQRVVDAPPPFFMLKGRSLSTIKLALAAIPRDEMTAILS